MIEKVEFKSDMDEQTLIAIEQYKEISTSRRHYSSLRFALFPVYFAIQYGIIQLVISDNQAEETVPFYVLSLCGILISYVFWTIESRIGMYYQMLEENGSRIEELLGMNQKVMKTWGKKNFLNNTKLSIAVVYIAFTFYWFVMTFLYFIG